MRVCTSCVVGTAAVRTARVVAVLHTRCARPAGDEVVCNGPVLPAGSANREARHRAPDGARSARASRAVEVHPPHTQPLALLRTPVYARVWAAARAVVHVWARETFLGAHPNRALVSTRLITDVRPTLALGSLRYVRTSARPDVASRCVGQEQIDAPIINVYM